MADPAKFDRFARSSCAEKHKGKCIDVIYGFLGGKKAWDAFIERLTIGDSEPVAAKSAGSEIQALRYRKTIWTESDARAHCKSRGGQFEAAKEEKK